MPTHSSQFRYELAVCIGRFQILHNAHLALLRRALALAPRCLVVIGSAHRARSSANPFTWRERQEMIRQALPEADRERLVFEPMRDHAELSRWVSAVRAAALAHGGASARTVLVGHRKDPTRAYLEAFGEWELDDPGSQGEVDSARLCAAFLLGGTAQSPAAAILRQVPPGVAAFLDGWARLPAFAQLADEARQLAAEKAQWTRAPYPPVLVTVDAVVRAAGRVLLIRRGRNPGKGLRALPGGFLDQRESLHQSALRELAEETGLRLDPAEAHRAFRAVRVFDEPDRSARGRVITHAHFFDLGDGPLPPVHGGDDAAGAEWVSIEQLPALEEQLLDDHFQILDFFLQPTPPSPG